LADIMAMSRYWFENNTTSDDQVATSYWQVIPISWKKQKSDFKFFIVFLI
jgi:hypothetical protein